MAATGKFYGDSDRQVLVELSHAFSSLSGSVSLHDVPARAKEKDARKAALDVSIG